VLRIAVAVAFTGAIMLASSDADARARFRSSSPSPKPAAAAPTAKPGSVPAEPKPFAAARPANPQPLAAAKPANPQPAGGGSFVVIGGGSRPASAAPQGTPARAVGDDASGPLQFDPTLAAADDKKPATECLTTPQTVAAKEPLVAREPAKDQVAANEPRKIEAAPPSTNPALVPVRPKRQAPVVATVCYVQRDGSCAPSY
jgi:hypothetical protein